jgi:hypothetical protein
MFLVISGDLGFGGDNPHKSLKNILLPNKDLRCVNTDLVRLSLKSISQELLEQVKCKEPFISSPGCLQVEACAIRNETN